MPAEKKKPVNKIRLTKAQISEGLKNIPIEQILGATKTGSTLTHKQKAFAKEVAMGETKAGAYRKVYKSKSNHKVVGNAASKLAKTAGVSMEIEAYRLAQEAREYLTGDRLASLVLHQLTIHALNEDIPPATRVRALELLGKSNGANLFLERKEVTTISASKDAKASLMDKIREAMNRNSIDVEYKDSGESLLDELKTVYVEGTIGDSSGTSATDNADISPETGTSATQSTQNNSNESDIHSSIHVSPSIDTRIKTGSSTAEKTNQFMCGSDSDPVPSENSVDETATPPMPLNEPLDRGPDMHNSLLTQSPVEQVTHPTNNINNDSQVIDSKGPSPTINPAQVDWVNLETPPVTLLNEKGEKNI